MMIDMTNRRFGRFVALKFVEVKNESARWLCLCDCGVEKVVLGSALRSGHTRSCGCLHRKIVAEQGAARRRTHGLSKIPEYRTWCSIKARCYNPKHRVYKYYGGKGIVMCETWVQSFEKFFADMGLKPTPKHSIERKNSKLNYTPDNCIWATQKEQVNNTCANVVLEWRGIRLNLTQWSEKTGISFAALHHRHRRNWDVERLLTTPVRGAKRHV